jgi:hypothetical protein
MSLVPADPPPVIRYASADDPLLLRRTSDRSGSRTKAKPAKTPGHTAVLRRQTHAVVGDHDSSPAEAEFMTAMQAYKQSSGRMFPTWSEVLEVLRSLGYEKVTESEPTEGS